MRWVVFTIALALRVTSSGYRGVSRAMDIFASLLSFTVVLAIVLSFLSAACNTISAALDAAAAMVETGGAGVGIAKRRAERLAERGRALLKVGATGWW